MKYRVVEFESGEFKAQYREFIDSFWEPVAKRRLTEDSALMDIVDHKNCIARATIKKVTEVE